MILLFAGHDQDTFIDHVRCDLRPLEQLGSGTVQLRMPAGVWMALAAVIFAAAMLASPSSAQQPAPGWEVDLALPDVRGAGPNTTVVPRKAEPREPSPQELGEIRLIGLLTADGQRIDRGLVWRVFEEQSKDVDRPPKLVSERRDASPLLKLPPGPYIINVAFGRSNLTRRVTVNAGPPVDEPFVLNAGGLRLTAQVGGKPAPAGSVTYDIQSDERDQSGNRATIMSNAKPGLIIRLNAGIYHIVSSYGDANAIVHADVTVEAGKLTEATVAHAAAKVTLKLVTRAGGDALPGIHWVLQTPDGIVVKESVGALPTHILAPGAYTAIAKSQGRAFRRDFTVASGSTTQVEVVMQ